MKLSDIGEFGLIRRFSPPFLTGLSDRVEGIGDDCAIIETDDTVQLVTTDMLVEEIHFLRDAIGPFDLGRKSLAVNLSDIAAMGGTPTSAYLSLGIPRELEVEWLDRFFEGLHALCDEADVALLGGDTTGSPGPLIVNLAVLGSCRPASLKLRRDARAGDTVCVTGELGDSAAGLRVLLEDLPRDGEAQVLLDRHHRPRAHLAEGAWLGGRAEVRAMLDVSDGIDSDCHRIMEASGCAMRIELERLPVSAELRALARREGWDAQQIAAGGGEDYCLMCTVETGRHEELTRAFEAAFGRPLTAIGRVVEGDDLLYEREGRSLTLDRHGWDHFGSA